jgi:transcriptional regulator with XRE-family HTH domain
MALGKKIRQLREELGMSQAQLSSQGALSQGYLSQLENDEVQNPSAAVIFRLAQALHIDPRVLMSAAGYNHIAGAPDGEEYEVTVDPELLRFLAKFPREQQKHLLHLLEGLDQRQGQPDERAVPQVLPQPPRVTHRSAERRSRAGVPTTS